MTSILRQKRRIRYVGESPVSLSDDVPEAVMFVTTPKLANGTVHHEPIGTAFVVTFPGYTTTHYYAVTAAHVVRSLGETSLRLRLPDGTPDDRPVPEWIYHPAADVAVAPMRTAGTAMKQVPVTMFAGVDPSKEPPQIGDDVFFIGLLRAMPAMAESNVPIVRSGSIGRLNQDGIRVVGPGHTYSTISGHLIDCRAYGGMSGSPCFVSKHIFELRAEGGLRWEHGSEIQLLGLITAHFDDWEAAVVPAGFEGKIRSAVNTGVGIVTPVEDILQTLMLEELVAQREQNDDPPYHSVATFDT